MNLAGIKQIVTSTTGRQLLKLQKNSPHILFGVGVAGIVGTAVTASIATLKVEGVLDEHEAQLEKIHYAVETAEINYSAQDAQKDNVVLYSKTILKLAQLYALPVGLGVMSIGCLAGSHRIMMVRNAALGAAFASMESAFQEYRQRVVNELGPDKDREFRFASEKLEVIEETKTGPQPKDLTRVDVNYPVALYARMFGPDNKNWERKHEYNLMFLRTAQQMLTDQLRARGHLFLNEAYDHLGMERTRVGAVVGWIYNGPGDDFVDFGIWDQEREDRLFDFVTGRENSILVDFNVCGNIWDKI